MIFGKKLRELREDNNLVIRKVTSELAELKTLWLGDKFCDLVGQEDVAIKALKSRN